MDEVIKQQHEDVSGELKTLLADILSNNCIDEEQINQISILRQKENELYNQLTNIQEEEKTLTKKDIVDILTDNGASSLLKLEDDGSISIGGSSIPKLTLMAQILELIATNGEDESTIELTPNFIRLVSENIDFDTKGITIHHPSFSGSTKITPEGFIFNDGNDDVLAMTGDGLKAKNITADTGNFANINMNDEYQWGIQKD